MTRRKHISCAEFTACMADMIAAGEDIFTHPHVRRCKLHQALLNDLEAIASAAKQMFPEVDPPDTLWDGIQARLAGEHRPDPIVSDPWPGCRVFFSIRVADPFDTNASPPPLAPSVWEERKAAGLHIFGSTRAIPRREERG
jgi:hypothetical protein